MKDFVSGKGGLPLNETVKYSSRARKYTMVLRNVMKGRRFFEFNSGRKNYIGIGPAYMEDGDIIAIFYGSQTPFIVRQHKQIGRYELIGDCYIHGLMHSEALEMDLLEETFVLI